MRSPSICFVVVSNTVDESFEDLVLSLRTFCPGADMAWYNSGERRETPFDLLRVPHDRPLKYMKITPAFFDILDWAASTGYDYIVNVETDMAFIKPGFLDFLEHQMQGVDYLATGLRYRTPQVSLWPAYRSLAGERVELSAIVGLDYTNRAFSPLQIFGRGYFSKLQVSDIYPKVRGFVERNQQPQRSWTLQELILPTLADGLGLVSRSYPPHLAVFNRYRPYQALPDVHLAQVTADAYFLHPIRRDPNDPVRSFVRALVRAPATSAHS